MVDLPELSILPKRVCPYFILVENSGEVSSLHQIKELLEDVYVCLYSIQSEDESIEVKFARYMFSSKVFSYKPLKLEGFDEYDTDLFSRCNVVDLSNVLLQLNDDMSRRTFFHLQCINRQSFLFWMVRRNTCMKRVWVN